MKNYDIIIIGAGAAGLTAAIYASRYKLKTLLITKIPGGIATTAHKICNFPTYENISGFDLMKKMEEHVKKLSAEMIYDEVTKISRQTLIFPDKKFQYFDSSPSAVIAKASDSFKKLLQLRAYFESIGYSQSERLTDELIEATKKVTLLNEDFSQSADYKQLIKRILDKYSKNSGMRLIFDADFSGYNMIYLFLMPKFIEKLSNKLEKSLKNGSTIVSHGFKIESLSKYLKKKVYDISFPTYIYHL